MKITRIWIFLLAAAPAVYWACLPTASRKEFAGSFYANDSGRSHGGFEWAGQYTARLTASDDKASLEIVFTQGLGDPLTRHQYSLTEFAEVAGTISFKIEGRQAMLIFKDADEIWSGAYNNSYVANKSDLASEQVGRLPVEAFPGLKSHSYVEIRLKAVNKEADSFLIKDGAFF